MLGNFLKVFLCFVNIWFEEEIMLRFELGVDNFSVVNLNVLYWNKCLFILFFVLVIFIWVDLRDFCVSMFEYFFFIIYRDLNDFEEGLEEVCIREMEGVDFNLLIFGFFEWYMLSCSVWMSWILIVFE